MLMLAQVKGWWDGGLQGQSPPAGAINRKKSSHIFWQKQREWVGWSSGWKIKTSESKRKA